ncbi:sulfite exporter TauE/SafE family protein [Pigmentiphaga soli]
MNESSSLLLPLLAATFSLAGLVKGVTGMGLPTVAMGLLGSFMSPAAAAAMLVVPSFVTNVWQLLAGPAVGRLLRRLWPMMLGIVAGTIGGSALLVGVDPLWSGLALGVALVAYAGYALVAPALSIPPRIEPWLLPIAGLLTGVVTGATGVFVIPAVPCLQALRLDKEELVQALGLSFTVSTVALAAGLMAHGAFRLEQSGLSALAVAPALAGMRLGQRIRARISPRRFRLCFLSFLLLLGLELALRPLF